jgi:hypothetical protein
VPRMQLFAAEEQGGTNQRSYGYDPGQVRDFLHR